MGCGTRVLIDRGVHGVVGGLQGNEKERRKAYAVENKAVNPDQ